jgi:hypothetical protein
MFARLRHRADHRGKPTVAVEGEPNRRGFLSAMLFLMPSGHVIASAHLHQRHALLLTSRRALEACVVMTSTWTKASRAVARTRHGRSPRMPPNTPRMYHFRR